VHWECTAQTVGCETPPVRPQKGGRVREAGLFAGKFDSDKKALAATATGPSPRPH